MLLYYIERLKSCFLQNTLPLHEVTEMSSQRALFLQRGLLLAFFSMRRTLRVEWFLLRPVKWLYFFHYLDGYTELSCLEEKEPIYELHFVRANIFKSSLNLLISDPRSFLNLFIR